MTSTNVFYLSFRNINTGEILHEHRQKVMCHERYDWDKILSLPIDDVEILTWGYDEEDEYWDNADEKLPMMSNWLDRIKLTNKELREKFNEQE